MQQSRSESIPSSWIVLLLPSGSVGIGLGLQLAFIAKQQKLDNTIELGNID